MNEKLSLERVLEGKNIEKALKCSSKRKSGHGIDGICYCDLKKTWEKEKNIIIKSIENKMYFPIPVRRTFINKKNSNGKRALSIPSCIDRMLQQAILQILLPHYEEKFSDNNYGYRKNRGTKEAVKKCLWYLNSGYEYIVNIDIEKFFDNVDHKILIDTLSEEIKDERLLWLVVVYIRYFIMYNEGIKVSIKGISQGGPLSPLLANIVLNILDKKLDANEIRYVRYADDVIMLFSNEIEAESALLEIEKFLNNKLRLSLNVEKTNIVKGEQLYYMGYSFGKYGFGDYRLKTNAEIINELRNRMKARIYDNIDDIVKWWDKIGAFNRGWVNYYSYIPEHHICPILKMIDEEQQTMIKSRLAGEVSIGNILSEEACWSILNSKEFVSLEECYYKMKREL